MLQSKVLLTILFVGAFSGAVHAQDGKGGPTPSPAGALVYFVDVKAGDTIPTKATVHFGLRGMGVAPAGSDRANAGHHHLLIDTDLPPLDKPIPNDFNHLHYGAGQTEAEVSLTPGEHTLQLLFGDKDHLPHSPPLSSPRIRVRVAEVYFVYPTNGAYVSRTPVIRFGLVNMGVAPAGIAKPNTGHHHLLIDAPVPTLSQPIPNDFNHLHFGAGQTEAKITLPLGEHTLQLLLGDENHVPHDPPVLSKPIKVTVTESGRRPRPRLARKYKRYR